jgi:transmembrane sensor
MNPATANWNELYQRYLSDTLTEQELQLFYLILLNPDRDREIDDTLQYAADNLPTGYIASMNAEKAKIIIDQIFEKQPFLPTVHRVHFLRTAWFRYVAAIVIIFGIGSYVFFSKKSIDKPIIVAEQNKQPGSDKATLTLSDGRQIILNNSSKENIADGIVSIEKTNGILTYNTASTAEASSNEVYNTMTTPRGGQYQLVLPDGSKVWLNSASNIKYPTVFQGKNRMVELSGEAYFDIKENKKLPFIVKTQNAEVLVLGTEFNINSYSDEPQFSATLINGSVKVLAGNTAKIILPGQQAQLLNAKPDVLSINNDVDINQITAWQKGIFEFRETTLEVIARQLSRWYDVEVLVGSNNKSIRFSGGINKKTPLKGLLKMLEINGVNNKWENNIITLYSK